MCIPALAPALAFIVANAGTIGTVAAIGGAATSIYGMQQSAKAQQAGLNYQAQVDEVNAVNADRAARDALERGELDAIEHGRKVAAIRGKQTNTMAAAGLDLGFGTPLDIAQDTDLLAAEDTSAIYENANREAEGFRISAANYRAGAEGARAQGKNVRTQALIDSASTVLNTASQLGDRWSKYGSGQKGK